MKPCSTNLYYFKVQSVTRAIEQDIHLFIESQKQLMETTLTVYKKYDKRIKLNANVEESQAQLEDLRKKNSELESIVEVVRAAVW
jgi:mevalonate kinase